MSYPNYPDNRIILIKDGTEVDLTIRFQLILLDGYKLDTPEPKTYSVDIPGGDGNIDLTEALMGDTAYKNRNQEFTMVVLDLEDEHTFEERKTEVSNYIHGRAFDYRLTMDPGYVYHGRFSIEENAHMTYSSGILGSFKIKVDANPYKSKGRITFNLNATGGKMFRLPSGRKRVHPIIEVTQPARVRFGDTITQVGAGSYTLNNVLFKDGYNDIYINTKAIRIVKWQDIGDIGGVTGAELIINGDFDYSDEGWEISGNHTIGTDSPHGGVGYLIGGISSLIYSDSIAIQSGRTYLLSVWLKSSDAAVIGTLTLMKSSDGSSFSEWSSTPISINAGSEWTQMSVRVMADSTVRYAHPKITLNGANVSIDDMSLQYNMVGLTWNDAKSLRWDDIQRLDINGENAIRSWEELSQKRWSDLSSYHWYDIDYRDQTVKDTSVYLKYDWKDL